MGRPRSVSYVVYSSFFILLAMGRPRSVSYVIYSSFFISCFIFPPCTASDTLTLGQSIKDTKTLVSSRKIFQLGFFSSPTELSNPYVGIWYYNLLIRRIIWVANRENSVMDSSGVLTLKGDGNLVILDGRQNTVWSTDTSSALNRSVEAVLLDTGNFVLRERDSGSSLGRILWQSFNYPTDTLLPGMMIGINQRTNESKKLTSWKDSKDPSPGAFSFGIDLQGLRQFFIFNGLNPYYKSMFWNGTSFEVLPLSSQRLVNFTVISNTDETYFTYSSSLSNYPSMVMDPSGKLNYIWYNGTGDAISEESITWSGPEHTCREYGVCGVYSSCNDNNTPICKCLPGFEPTSQSDWFSGDWSEGCKRKTPLHCGNGKEDKFLEMQGMQLGTLESVQGPANATAEACRAECLKDCLCLAYANVSNDVCTYWKEDLQDVKEAEEVNMVDLYLRLAPSELETPGRSCPNCGANIIPYPLSTGPDCGDPDYSNFHCNTTSGQLRFGALNGVSYAITNIKPIRRTFEIQLEEARVCWPTGAKSKDVNLNRSLPFSFTNGNTILLLNCATPLLMSRASCTSSSLCQRYVGEGPASCLDSATCCSYVAGDFSPSSSHSIGVMNTPCSAYTSILNENLTKPASNWQVGMEIGWDPPPEPVCNSTNDCRSWPHTMCLPDGKKIGRRRCICNANFKWNSLSLNCTPDDFRNTGMRRSSGKKRPLALIVTITVIAGILFMGALIFSLWRMAFKIKGIKVKNSKKHSTHSRTRLRRDKDSLHTNGFGEDGKEELNVPYFDFETLASATENFADYNKLGQGGFGPVYKGKLPDGQEIAVKRLSQSSGQGQEEFKNEVVLIAKLQHRNLVRLLGYCIEGDEKMLLYEFLPNKSLDLFIFDPNQCKLLDWERRFNIIIGIARGLLYLHQDSRLRIIHRDLKTSNVLLDEEMNPKISDFGMARMFGGNQIEANTIRVVGTYGYMSPEYASHGIFSIKSDVFSFGVILLEIVCGKKNTVFYESQDSLTLLGHAWQLWNEGKGLDLIEPSISLKCNTSLALKCIHVGLLCVQEDPKARPTMASIITMLGSETAVSVTPKKPAFFMSLGHAHLSLEEQSSSSRNDETMSTMDGR